MRSLEPAPPQACAAYFERLFLIRVRRVLSFARSFLATAFLIMFIPASGLGFVGASMEEILSSLVTPSPPREASDFDPAIELH